MSSRVVRTSARLQSQKTQGAGVLGDAPLNPVVKWQELAKKSALGEDEERTVTREADAEMERLLTQRMLAKLRGQLQIIASEEWFFL